MGWVFRTRGLSTEGLTCGRRPSAATSWELRKRPRGRERHCILAERSAVPGQLSSMWRHDACPQQELVAGGVSLQVRKGTESCPLIRRDCNGRVKARKGGPCWGKILLESQQERRDHQ